MYIKVSKLYINIYYIYSISKITQVAGVIPVTVWCGTEGHKIYFIVGKLGNNLTIVVIYKSLPIGEISKLSSWLWTLV